MAVRLLFRYLVYATLALLLVMVVVIGDLALNRRRLFYLALGRDALVAACRPALLSRLAADGFQPETLAFGEEPDITFSTLAGKTLSDTFTFEDGAARTRVDGLVDCGVKDGQVAVKVRTSATPVRAT